MSRNHAAVGAAGPAAGSAGRRTAQRVSALTRVLATGWQSLGGTGAVLGLLVMVSVFVAVAGPRESLDLRTGALQEILTHRSAPDRSLLVQADLAAFPEGIGPAQLSAIGAGFTQRLAGQGIPLQPDGAWAGLATPYGMVGGAGPGATRHNAPPQLELVYRAALSRHARLLAGRLPRAASLTFARGQVTAGRFEVAVTQRMAAVFGLRPGTRLVLAGPDQSLSLTVTGILAPAGPRSAFWTTDPVAAAPFRKAATPAAAPYWMGAAFIGPGELIALEQVFAPKGVSISWDYPVAVRKVDADQARALLDRLTAAVNGGLGNAEALDLSASSGLFTVLPGFLATQSATETVLDLLIVSLTALGAVAVLLGAQLLARRREEEFTLLRARGASAAQLGVYALAGVALAAIPAAALGAAAALAATPGPAAGGSWQLATLALLVAVAGPPAIAVRRHAGGARRGRLARDAPASGGGRAAGGQVGTDGSARKRRARRLVSDATVCLACAGGLIVLRMQGLPAAGAANLYVTAAPALLAAPVALLAARLCPPATRQALRLAGRRRGATVFLGLANAARGAALAALPIFGLVLALTTLSFGAMTREAIARGQQAASWQAAGADAVIAQAGSDTPVTPRLTAAVGAVPGVRRTASAAVIPGVTPGMSPVQLVVVDPARYAELTGATPFPAFPAARLARPAGWAPGQPVPAIASPLAAHLLAPGPATVSTDSGAVPVRVAATLPSTPAVPASGSFVIIGSWAAPRLGPPNLLLVGGARAPGAAIRAALRRLLPGGVLTLRSQVLRSLAQAPLPRGAATAFALGSVVAGALGVLIVLLWLTLTAHPREADLARLATMGLDRGQARRLSMLEASPPLAAAIAAGAACAAALAPLAGPELYLSAFTGSGARVRLVADPLAVGGAAAVVALLAAAALTVQVMLATRRGPAATLRAGG